jgi:hypothetical protein
MTLREFLAHVGLGIVLIFILYLFGYIRPNKENLPFMVEKNQKTTDKTQTPNTTIPITNKTTDKTQTPNTTIPITNKTTDKTQTPNTTIPITNKTTEVAKNTTSITKIIIFFIFFIIILIFYLAYKYYQDQNQLNQYQDVEEHWTSKDQYQDDEELDYKKLKIRKDLILLSDQINSFMKKYDFYHSIFYELKKIKDFLDFKFFLFSNEKLKNLLDHLKDIEKILIQIYITKRKTNNIDYKFNIDYMLLMTYDQMVTILKEKYGTVKGDYFLDKQCTKFNPFIKRAQEGLHIHHIKENERTGLSIPKYAKNAPFEYQKSKNLVYCDLLEHFLLHCKIWDHSKNPLQIDIDVGKSGAFSLLRRLEDDFYRKTAQRIYSQEEFRKCNSFFQSLKIYSHNN